MKETRGLKKKVKSKPIQSITISAPQRLPYDCKFMEGNSHRHNSGKEPLWKCFNKSVALSPHCLLEQEQIHGENSRGRASQTHWASYPQNKSHSGNIKICTIPTTLFTKCLHSTHNKSNLRVNSAI